MLPHNAMSNSLPITVQIGALPASVKWTPQQLADAIAARMSLVSAQTFALFVTGSTAPTSDVGPWLRTSASGGSWYVWSSTTGSYQPITIDSASLGYFIGEATPDHNLYSFWIQTTAGGSPLALKIYYSGAWVDVYATTLASYLTTAAAAATYAPIASPTLTGVPAAPTAAGGTNTTQLATTAFVTAAIAAIPGVTIVAGQGIFRAVPSADQDIVHGGAGALTTDVDFGTESFDPDGAFGTNIFTAPADGYYHFEASLQLSLQAGVPTDLDFNGTIVPSGGSSIPMSGRDDTGTGQAFSAGSGTVYMTTGQTAKVQVNSNTDAACTVRINSGGSFFSGFRVR